MNNQLILTITSAIFISSVSAYIGTLMLSRKMSVITDPLAHLAFPGVTIALILGIEISVGIFPFIILGAIIIWLLEKRTKLPIENLSAIIFAIGVGTALLFLPIEEAEEALVGIIDKINLNQTFLILFLSLIGFVVSAKIYPKVMLINIDEDLAKAEKIDVDKYNLIYLLIVALVIGLGVYLVGGLITAALIAIPAATAKNISNNLSLYKTTAIICGILSSVIGILAAHFFSLPTGPMIIVISVILFIISLLLKK
ncbi:MAG: membrane protein [Patescibacteria group bacterium]|nr:MAG: membrane protein [Patescibacteria group bacterium]